MARSDPAKAVPLNLAAALKLGGMVVERRATIPILTRARLTTNGTGAVIETTDLDNTVRIATAIDIPKCDVTIDYGSLSRAVQATGADAIAVSLKNKAATIGVNPAVTLPLLDDADEFPSARAITGAVPFDLDAVDLAKDLGRVFPAISSEETRYYLNGVLFDLKERLSLASTDGHRLHVASRPAPVGLAELAQSIVPTRTIKVIRAALAAQPDVEMVRCEFEAARARFVIGAVEIIAKLIDGTYPDYTRIIRTDHAGYIDVAPSAIIGPSRVAQAIIGGRAVAIALRPIDGNIHAKSADGISVTAEFDRELTGLPAEEISFRTQYLIGLLSGFDTKTVSLSFGQTTADPMQVSSEDDSFLAVLMPMRI